MFPDLTSPDLTTVSKAPYNIIDQAAQWIPVAKNTRLAARLWRPDITDAVPVVIEIIPYRRQDGTLPVDERIHPYWAGHGVAALRVEHQPLEVAATIDINVIEMAAIYF